MHPAQEAERQLVAGAGGEAEAQAGGALHQRHLVRTRPLRRRTHPFSRPCRTDTGGIQRRLCRCDQAERASLGTVAGQHTVTASMRDGLQSPCNAAA